MRTSSSSCSRAMTFFPWQSVNMPLIEADYVPYLTGSVLLPVKVQSFFFYDAYWLKNVCILACEPIFVQSVKPFITEIKSPQMPHKDGGKKNS